MKITLGKDSFDVPKWKVAVTGVISLVAALMIMYAPGTANSQFLYYFAAAVLGHFVGDYTFQNQYMATEKSYSGKRGHIACTVHVFCYTVAIAMFTGWHPLFLLVVAIPHWIIDRWGLAWYILKFKNGYGPHQIWEDAPLCAAPAPGALQQNVWKVAFAAPIYIFNDNVLHWVCLWFTVKYLLN
jgi:hypothetical protein